MKVIIPISCKKLQIFQKLFYVFIVLITAILVVVTSYGINEKLNPGMNIFEMIKGLIMVCVIVALPFILYMIFDIDFRCKDGVD
jgi:hypothetical protein